MNLSAKDPSINYDTVTEEVAQLFCQTYAPGKDVKVIYNKVAFYVTCWLSFWF